MTTVSIPISIPDDLPFSSLKLARDADGAVSFNWSAIEKICAASGIDPQYFATAGEDAVGALIVNWYAVHKQSGGIPDPVAEDLIAEVKLEDQFGGGTSHQPGQA